MPIATHHSKPSRRKSSREKNPAAVAALRKKYGLSQGLLARLLDVSLRTVSKLETDPTAPAPRTVTQIARLCSALSDVMQVSFIPRWLDQPNEMLRGLKPVEAIERGELDLVWQVVIGLQSGSQL